MKSEMMKSRLLLMIVNEIVEETLEEAEAMSSVKAKGSAKDETPASEPVYCICR